MDPVVSLMQNSNGAAASGTLLLKLAPYLMHNKLKHCHHPLADTPQAVGTSSVASKTFLLAHLASTAPTSELSEQCQIDMSQPTFLDPTTDITIQPNDPVLTDQLAKLVPNANLGPLKVESSISKHPVIILNMHTPSVIEKLSGLRDDGSNFRAVTVSVKTSPTQVAWTPLISSTPEPSTGDIKFLPMPTATQLRIEFTDTIDGSTQMLIPSMKVHACKQGQSTTQSSTMSGNSNSSGSI